MYDIAPEVVSIADACLGGLQGRSALLIGSSELFYPYVQQLRQARMKYIYQEETAARVPYVLPNVQLLISLPTYVKQEGVNLLAPILTAANIARGCEGRRSPLFIFDLAPSTSVEELAGLLPAVCLYTPEDLQHILAKAERKAS